MRTITLLLIGICLTAGALLTGCGIQKRPPQQKQTFLLDVRRPAEIAVSSAAACLHIRPCRAAAGFSGNQLVYRTGQVTYEQDYYNSFLVSPEDQIAEHLSRWFLESKLFACPPKAESVTVEPYLDFIYADFQDIDHPSAVVSLHVRATRTDNSCSCPIVVLDKTYSAATPLATTPAAADIVTGLSTTLNQILLELEQDLALRVKALPL